MDGKVRARRSRGFPKGCPLDDFPPPASITVAHSDLSGSDDSDNRVPQTGGTVCYTPQQAKGATVIAGWARNEDTVVGVTEQPGIKN